MKIALEFTFQINAQAYSFEVMNPRHMHEWRQVEEVGVPDGKILIPGLIGHANNYVEHPELIAEYICNYASIVGKENVIAGADCGFSSRASYAPRCTRPWCGRSSRRWPKVPRSPARSCGAEAHVGSTASRHVGAASLPQGVCND